MDATPTCPNCGPMGTPLIDPISQCYVCKKCGTSISTVQGRTKKETKTLPKPPKAPSSNYPPVPHDAIRDDIIEEFEDDAKKVKVATIYCPAVRIKDEADFDPNTNQAKFAAYVYKHKFANRKRYLRESTKMVVNGS